MEHTHIYRVDALRPAAASVQPREPRGDYQVAVTIYVPSDKARAAMTIDEREALALGVAGQLNAGAATATVRRANLALEARNAELHAICQKYEDRMGDASSYHSFKATVARNLGILEPAANHPTLEGQDTAPPLSYTLVHGDAVADDSVDVYQMPARGELIPWDGPVTDRGVVLSVEWTGPRTANISIGAE